MRCTLDNWVVFLTTRFLVYLSAASDGKQYTVGKLTMLARGLASLLAPRSKMKHSECLPPLRCLGLKASSKHGTLCGHWGLALVATDCGCNGWHMECFQSCSWCRVELPTSKYSLNTSMTKRLRAEDLFVSVVVFENLRKKEVQHFYNTHLCTLTILLI